MREIIDAKVQRWSIPPKQLSLQMGVGVSLSYTTNIDVYVWLDEQCLAFIIFHTAVLQCCSAGLDVTWDFPLILYCMSFFYFVL